jgi:folate-binding protein YgfZ
MGVPTILTMPTDRLTATPIERDIVLAEGADARSYLQTQLTQDVEALAIGESAWSFILDAKSSIEAFVRITRIGSERIAIDVDPGLGDGVRQRLDGLLFRTKVSFSQDSWSGISWLGPGAQDQRVDAPIVAVSPWHDTEGLDVIGPTVTMPEGVEVISAAEWEDARIASGWPAMNSEITEGVVPAMTGLVSETVSFEKGCYTGQELVARVYHRGAEPVRSLVAMTASADNVIESGDELVVSDTVVGSVTSVARSELVGLGYVKRGTVVPGTANVPSGPVDLRTP